MQNSNVLLENVVGQDSLNRFDHHKNPRLNEEKSEAQSASKQCITSIIFLWDWY